MSTPHLHWLTLWLSGYLVNSAWQVAALAGAAALAARPAARLGAATVHRLWAGALAAAVLLPVIRTRGWSLDGLWHGSAAGGGQVRTAMGATTASAAYGLTFAPWLLHALLAAWLGCVLFAAARLVWGMVQVRGLRRSTYALSAAETATLRLCGVSLPPGVQTGVVKGLPGPTVVGSRRPLLLLPKGFLGSIAPQDLRAALAHELAHVERHDYGRNLLYSVLALPVAYHPCVWLLRARMTESREMACDDDAATRIGDARHYAQSLLRLAAQRPRALRGAAGTAMGIFDGRSLERRITTMMHTHKQLRGPARAAALAALTLFAAGAGVATAAARMDVGASAAAKPIVLHVKAGVMEGQIVSRPSPVYPPQAKAGRQQGTVTLAAVINRQGDIEHLKVVHSAGKWLDQSAMKAVRQWKYKPYLLNGNPVEVDTNINVTYTLGR